MESKITNINAITLFIADTNRAKQFYLTAFNWPILFEDDASVLFNCGNCMINLLLESQAPDLIAPAKTARAEEGSRMQLTILVDDVDEVVSVWKSRRVPVLNGPIDRPWGRRTACIQDPDGHVWEVAEEIPTPAEH